MFLEFLLILCYVSLVDLEKWSSHYCCGIWFTSGLARHFPEVLTFFSQYFGEIMTELMLQGRFWNWFHPYAVCDKEVTPDVDLPFTTRRHILPFLRCRYWKFIHKWLRSAIVQIISEFLCSYWMQERWSDTKGLILLKMRGVITAQWAMKWNSPSDIIFHRFKSDSLGYFY